MNFITAKFAHAQSKIMNSAKSGSTGETSLRIFEFVVSKWWFIYGFIIKN